MPPESAKYPLGVTSPGWEPLLLKVSWLQPTYPTNYFMFPNTHQIPSAKEPSPSLVRPSHQMHPHLSTFMDGVSPAFPTDRSAVLKCVPTPDLPSVQPLSLAVFNAFSLSYLNVMVSMEEGERQFPQSSISIILLHVYYCRPYRNFRMINWSSRRSLRFVEKEPNRCEIQLDVDIGTMFFWLTHWPGQGRLVTPFWVRH